MKRKEKKRKNIRGIVNKTKFLSPSAYNFPNSPKYRSIIAPIGAAMPSQKGSPTSLMPHHTATRTFAAAAARHGAVPPARYVPKSVSTWSSKLYCAYVSTMSLSVVAPVTARSYASTSDEFRRATTWPTQFSPPDVVWPGNDGLPIGLAADGAAPPTHELVVE